MVKYKVFNIHWDIDSEDDVYLDEVPNLPSEVLLYANDDEEMSLRGADSLSDLYGYCVFSFSFERT